MYNLFLDDIRIPDDVLKYWDNPIYESSTQWVIVRNYDQFVKAITEQGIPEMISFDHDLGPEHYFHQENISYDQFTEKTGFHCAKWFINYCIDNNKEVTKLIYVHSMNPVGSKNILSLFTAYQKSINDSK